MGMKDLGEIFTFVHKDFCGSPTFDETFSVEKKLFQRVRSPNRVFRWAEIDAFTNHFTMMYVQFGPENRLLAVRSGASHFALSNLIDQEDRGASCRPVCFYDLLLQKTYTIGE